MLFTEWNWDDALAVRFEEGREEVRAEMGQVITAKDQVITEKDLVITEKDQKIEELRRKLREAGIDAQ
jgi:hypothetical protein